MSSETTTGSEDEFEGENKHDSSIENIYQRLTRSFLSYQPSIDLAEALISLGFARITDAKETVAILTSADDKVQLKKYYDQLDKIQAKAKRNRRGLWASTVPPAAWPLSVIKSYVSKFFRDKLLPARARLPELVR